MDGRGRCLDNVFIERLWRSLKYEAVYLHELADGFAAERVIAAWMTFLQSRTSALGARRTHTGRSLLRGARGVSTRAAGRGIGMAGVFNAGAMRPQRTRTRERHRLALRLALPRPRS